MGYTGPLDILKKNKGIYWAKNIGYIMGYILNFLGYIGLRL